MADTVDGLVRFRSLHDEAKPMVIDLDRRLSYRELDITTHDLAVAFADAGVVKGTRVGLISPTVSVGCRSRLPSRASVPCWFH
jgi:acyl-CoA synthetase (AMP-forming)/AMP-acid ligase II